jgi:uncharacterized protein YciI
MKTLTVMRSAIIILLLSSGFSVFGQAKTYSFVFLHKKSDAAPMPKEQLAKLMEGHMANITRLAEEGKLIAAGPFEGGGGIFVLNTTSVEEAGTWLSTDPGIKANRWDIEILPYTPRIRSVCAVSEPYEMVTYHFIRFIVAKPATQNQQSIFNQHDSHLKQMEQKGDIVTEATFGEFKGGILVLKGELPKEYLDSDPAVREGILSLDLKKLWIAKGAFCEK